ncbi:MAG TPA: hypothetical protein VK837_01425 [Longimicrobiales bacterium]|nr:hypothetical protein [Longimicrobiales bacterium]
MRYPGTALIVALAAISTTGATRQLAAQELTVDPRAGLSVPVGGLGSRVDVGVAAGLGVTMRVHPRWSIRADVAVEDYEGGFDAFAGPGEDLPLTLEGARVWRYEVGVEADAIVPGLVPLTVVVGAGIGGASLRAISPSDASLRGDHPGAQADVKVGWDFSRRWNAFAGLEAAAVFTGDADAGSAARSLGGGTIWAFPLTVGVRLRLY